MMPTSVVPTEEHARDEFPAREVPGHAHPRAPASSGPRTLGPRREGRAIYEVLPAPEAVPLYDLVTVRGPGGEVLEGYRGVQRRDTTRVVSVVSSRYGLVQHRDVAAAVHAVGTSLDQGSREEGARFSPETIRLYAGGRRLEHKLVVPRRFALRPGEDFYPGIRVFNSLDGSWAVRVEGFALRLACTNQLYAGAEAMTELRELHLASSGDMLGLVERAIYSVLERFEGALDVYAKAMDATVRVVDVGPSLEAHGLPERHARAIQVGLPELGGTPLWTEISRWDAYQVATRYLSHDVHVSPERERHFERAAARALLLPETYSPGVKGGH